MATDPFEAAGFIPVGGGGAPRGGGGMIIEKLPGNPPAPKTTYRTMTAAEVQAAGFPAGSYRVSSDGKVEQIAAPPAPGKGGGPADGLTPTARAKLVGQEKAMRLVEKQLDRVEGLYNKHLKGVGLQSFAEYLPTPANRAFEKAAQGILPLIRQALSTSAKDGDSDKELAVWQNLLPSHRAMDSENEENIATMRRMIKANRAETAAILNSGKPAAKSGWKVIRRR